MQRRVWAAPMALALALGACQGPEGKLAPRPPQASAKAPAAAPSQAPLLASSAPLLVRAEASASASASAASPSPALALSLPLRLGLALPASVVGAAKGHLEGVGGSVAREGTRLGLGVGGLIVSNNSGSILSNHGASLVSDQGGAALGGQAASRRLLAQRGLLQAVAFPNDPRFDLWEQLLFIDLADQILNAYAKAGPQLDRWVPFQLQATLLPTPVGQPLFEAAMQAGLQATGPLPYSGRLVREGDSLRLWFMRLPQPGAKPSEGQVALDLRAPSQGPLVARFATPQEFRVLYGLEGGAARLEHQQGGGLRLRSADRSVPWAQMSEQTRLLVSARHPVARHRVVLMREAPGGHTELRMAEAQRTELKPDLSPGPWGVRFLRAFGFAGPSQLDQGLAYWLRSGEGVPSDAIPLDWLPTPKVPLAEGQVPAVFRDPEGSTVATPSAALQGLQPLWAQGDESLIPRMPTAEERLYQDPELAPEPPPAALLALP